MNMEFKVLINELVRQALKELKPNPKGWDLRRALAVVDNDQNLFDLEKFISMPQKIRLYYLRTRRDTKFLGEGSSRIVYRIPGNLALKLAKNTAGIAQNRAEKLAVSCGYPRYYAKVWRTAKDNSWIIMEQGERISHQKFRQITGYGFPELYNALIYVLNDRGKKNSTNAERKAYENLKTDSWFRGLSKMMLACKLEPGDLAKPSSWGIDQKGNVVLIDYGLASNVWNKFYDQ